MELKPCPLFCEALSEDVAFETKQTNGDKIRSMSDEELAEWYFNEFFPKAPYCNKPECFEDSPCEKCLLDWLRTEVTG